MNYNQLPCGTPIPPEGLKAWVRDFENANWKEAKIIACNHLGEYPIITTEECKRKFYTITDPNAKKKRLMTPMELAGKWIKNSGLNWDMVVEVNNGAVFVSKDHIGKSMRTLQDNGWKWADHPSAEAHDSFEVEETT